MYIFVVPDDLPHSDRNWYKKLVQSNRDRVERNFAKFGAQPPKSEEEWRIIQNATIEFNDKMTIDWQVLKGFF